MRHASHSAVCSCRSRRSSGGGPVEDAVAIITCTRPSSSINPNSPTAAQAVVSVHWGYVDPSGRRLQFARSELILHPRPSVRPSVCRWWSARLLVRGETI